MAEFIQSRIHLFTPEHGGRTSPVEPFSRRYPPHLRVGTDGEYLGVRLVGGPPAVHPGDSAVVTWELLYEGVDYSQLQPEAVFEILEGTRTVGTGTVMRRWEAAEAYTYEVVRGSDLERDGMFLVLDRVLGSERETLLEIFYSDVNGHITFSAYEPFELPLERVEEFLREARRQLPPNRHGLTRG